MRLHQTRLMMKGGYVPVFQVISICLAGLSLVIAFAGWLETRFTFREKFATLTVKVDTLWVLLIRDAQTEIIGKGLAKKNSPMRVEPEVLGWMSPLQKELQAFYKALPENTGDKDALYELERRFGEKIMNICITHSVSEKIGLLIALSVAKGNKEVFNGMGDVGNYNHV